MSASDNYLLLDKDDVTLQLGSISYNELREMGYSCWDIRNMLINNVLFEGKYVIIEDFVVLPRNAKWFHETKAKHYYVTSDQSVYSVSKNTGHIKKLHTYTKGNQSQRLHIGDGTFNITKVRNKLFGGVRNERSEKN